MFTLSIHSKFEFPPCEGSIGYVVYAIIFVRCVSVRCVSAAIVGGGDKPPCATGRVRSRIVIVVQKCDRYSESSYSSSLAAVFSFVMCANQVF